MGLKFKNNEYENFHIPQGAKTVLETGHSELLCANCIARIKAEDSYPSKTIFNDEKVSYCICEYCYENEKKENKE